MHALALTATTVLALLFGAAKTKEPAAPADPNAVVGKAHGGKVWVQKESFPSLEGDRLVAWLGGNAAAPELARETKDGPWSLRYLAVFKKPSVKGPMTIQFFDKSEPGTIVEQDSPSNDEAGFVFQSSYELSPDSGFNKGHTYLIKVGQILKGKFVSYATGELTLK